MATLRFDKALSETEKLTAAEQCRAAGANCVAFASSQRFDCTYASLEALQDDSADRIRAQFPSAAVWDVLIIALAIEPSVSEALPSLESAFGGAGKPAGVVRCQCRAGSAVLEIVEARTSLALILALTDVELRRFGNAGRRIHPLSPFPIELQGELAARGLDLPRIDRSQILEVLIEQSYA